MGRYLDLAKGIKHYHQNIRRIAEAHPEFLLQLWDGETWQKYPIAWELQPDRIYRLIQEEPFEMIITSFDYVKK